MPKALSLFLLTASLLCLLPLKLSAFETDQYNLSPVPLGDIGDEVNDHVAAKIFGAIAAVNDEIAKHEACIADIPAKCRMKDSAEKRLAYLRSEAGVVEAVFRALGGGTSTRSDLGRWFAAKKFAGQPDRYRPSYGESIYKLNLGDFLTQSPTIKMWGVEFGFDKLEHFFQEGHKYYKIAQSSRAKGKSEADAIRDAIEWGQLSERTFYGYWVSGVYSQADLFSNYAGMKFYRRLTRSVKVAGREYAPLLKISEGRWAYDAASIRETLLKPFITDHLNEALNPSAYRLTLIRSIRRNVRKFACAEWRAKYPREEIVRRSDGLTTWEGEDYGFVQKSRVASVAETCFLLVSGGQ